MASVEVALRWPEVAAIRGIGHARIDLFDDFAAVAPVWDRLEAAGAFGTPFGRRDWITLWQRNIGAGLGLRPLIAVGRERGGEPLFLLPLALRRGRMFSVARFFGGTHSQLNTGLWHRDVAAAVTAADLEAVLATIAERRGIDLFLLLNPPAMWDARRNPLPQHPHLP